MKRRLLVIFVVVLLTTLLSGCWDRKDIETRGYVLGIAIDTYPLFPKNNEHSQTKEAAEEEKKKLDKMEVHTGEYQYAMTVQLPILGKNGAGSQGGNEAGNNSEKKTLEITQNGNTFMSMNREMQSRTGLSLYYEHLEVIVLSEEIARDGIEKIIDLFVRDPEMQRRVKIFVSKDDAKSILNIEPKMEEFSSIYLTNILLNSRTNSRIIHKADLGEVIKSIHAGLDFVLPMTQVEDDEIKASGGAAFHNGKMVDWVSELEMEAFKLIRNLYLGGVESISAPEREQGIITMEVTRAKSKITPVITGDNVAFNIDIQIKGNYAETVDLTTSERIDQSLLNRIEKDFEKEVERICNNVINRMQLECCADIFRFNQILQAEEPVYWKKVSDQWDLMYPNIEVNIHADVSLQPIGLVQ